MSKWEKYRWSVDRNTDDQVAEILIVWWEKYLWPGERNTDDQLAADTLANSPRLSSLPPPPFYSWNTARPDNNCTTQTAASEGHRCMPAGQGGVQGPCSSRGWPGGSEQGGWWDTGEQVKKEGAGSRRIGWPAVQSQPRPSWRVPTPPALCPKPPKLGRQQQLCRQWTCPQSPPKYQTVDNGHLCRVHQVIKYQTPKASGFVCLVN